MRWSRNELAQQVKERTANLTLANKQLQQEINERSRAETALLESNHRLENVLAELQETQQLVIQQERLHALGQMASGIAHDFNNALAPILGFSEVLLGCPKNLDDKKKLTRYLQLINTSAGDAANVVRRLREFYRSREEHKISQRIDLNRLIEGTILLTKPKWKGQAQANGININIDIHVQKVPRLVGNEAELREALTNSIFNAVDAMSNDGTITIRTRCDDQHIHLEVSSTGIGMTGEVRRQCLKPFFSTKGQQGTGLGLSIGIRYHPAARGNY